MLFRTTLDIDKNDKEYVGRILEKIGNCKNFINLKIYESKSKGFHIILFCNKKCDICRMVYDDSTRFYYDSYRPEWARNILFDKTEEINNEN